MAHPTVLSSAEVKRVFGSFSYTPNGASAINISPSWVAANIATVYVPALGGVQTYGGKFNGRVRFHRKGIEQLQRVFAEIEANNLRNKLLFWDGSFVPRRMRGSNSLSRHSWGVALDLNAQWNGFGAKPAAPGTQGSLWEVLPIFEKHGFASGLRWKRPDGMHFEIAELKDYSTEELAPDTRLVVNDDTANPIPVELRDGQAFASLLALQRATNTTDRASVDRMVPVGQMLRTLGYTVAWDGDTRKIYAYKNAGR